MATLRPVLPLYRLPTMQLALAVVLSAQATPLPLALQVAGTLPPIKAILILLLQLLQALLPKRRRPMGVTAPLVTVLVTRRCTMALEAIAVTTMAILVIMLTITVRPSRRR